MKKKYILKHPKISRELINILNNSSLNDSNYILEIINQDLDEIISLPDNSQILIPAFFNKDLEGNYSLENNLIYEEIISLQKVISADIIFTISFEDNFLNFAKILKFTKSITADDFHKENLIFESDLTQKSLLKNFSSQFLDIDGFKAFYNLFTAIRDSGNGVSHNFLILQKLDQIMQEVSFIRKIPFFLRTNSIVYRLLKPFLAISLLLRHKIGNIKNRIKILSRKSFKEENSKNHDEALSPFLELVNKNVPSRLIKFGKQKEPLLSIIIPVFGNLEFLSRCLYSIQLAKIDLTYEVIVVDDCGNESVSSKFSDKKNGVKLIQNKKNLGFTLSCNNGAKKAAGDYLCFLNSDTIVTDFWADSAIETFKSQTNVGVVGPRLLNNDGTLQESGGIVFSNGDAANIGKNKRSDNSWFKYVKEVDYVSGASLFISKKDFKKVGGFDENFSPAYYEDTSLCLDVRHKLNKRVMVNPLSSVIHHEGATNGRDESSGFKKYQALNKSKFFEKHRVDLKDYGKSYEDIINKRDKYIKGNILIIDQCIPTPREDSGSKDMDNIIQAILDLNYRPHLFALSNRGETLETDIYYKKGVHCIFGEEHINFKSFIKKYGDTFEKIIISRVNSYEEISPDLIKFSPNSYKLFYTVDLHHIRLKSEFKKTKNGLVNSEYKRTKVNEINAIHATDKTIVLSDKEKFYLVDECNIPSDKIDVWPLIRNEIDNLDNFKKLKKSDDIIFIGGFRHTPNIQAVKLLEREILPKVKELFGKAGISYPIVKIYGSQPNEYIKNLDNEYLSYQGFIENEEDAFSSARISLAPIPFGSGMKGKTLSSLIYKTPIVGSSFAFEGFQIFPEKIALMSELDPKVFAKNVLKAYVESEKIDDIEWSNVHKDLNKKFSYKSFIKKLESDLID
tara:strand:- start:732 stop:3443 length:2712 start_codon:yes stop_codon:yes gene_type:complete